MLGRLPAETEVGGKNFEQNICSRLDSLPVSFCGDCLFVVGTNIRRTAKMIRRTAKIAITTEGLGGTEPFLSRSLWCDTGLRKILHFA